MRAWVRKRPRKGGASFQVLFRRGGRAYAIENVGTFRLKRDADQRRDAVQAWLAQGLDPHLELDKLANPPVSQTFEAATASWLTSLVDVDPNTVRTYKHAVAYWTPLFGKRDPRRLTVDDVQRAVSASELAPTTLRTYRAPLRAILDHAGLDPNPARSALLKWPRIEKEEINPPPADAVVAILERVSKTVRLPLLVAEQCGMRVGEVQTLEWGDVDEQGCRFRLRRQSTKRGRARWVPVPEWLMDVIADLLPREDRTPDRRVFVGFNDATARGSMQAACKLAGIAHYHPHDFRHRRISLWFQQGESPVQIAAWAGHRASMSLDVYGHVLVGGEVSEADLKAVIGITGDAAVMPKVG